MTILVTGAAGFIGFHVTQALLARGERVIGIDNVNDYYDTRLKEARIEQLAGKAFTFHRLSIADHAGLQSAFAGHKDITGIINLAAMAGVRYSLVNPYAYIDTNITGHVAMLELARNLPSLRHFVYASSASVYGGNGKLPFSIDDEVNQPLSLYAATKRADELISHAYAHLHKIPQTGLRFFNVYGPWGRPDAAAFIFTKAIIEGQPIQLFGNGNMRRDFTYIDDIVAGVLAALDRPPVAADGVRPVKIYNLGNHRSEPLPRFVNILEEAIGKKAIIELAPMQAADIPEAIADIEASQRDLGFAPKTTIEEGLPRFVQWYRQRYN
jgi:UDP-glucuronate 4-epimerase